MRWLEIVKVRSIGERAGLLEGLRDQTASSLGIAGLVDVSIYRHASVESDASLHLRWESDRPELNGSALGRQLTEALKEFGLVDHSVWVEEERVEDEQPKGC